MTIEKLAFIGYSVINVVTRLGDKVVGVAEIIPSFRPVASLLMHPSLLHASEYASEKKGEKKLCF